MGPFVPKYLPCWIKCRKNLSYFLGSGATRLRLTVRRVGWESPLLWVDDRCSSRVAPYPGRPTEGPDHPVVGSPAVERRLAGDWIRRSPVEDLSPGPFERSTGPTSGRTTAYNSVTSCISCLAPVWYTPFRYTLNGRSRVVRASWNIGVHPGEFGVGLEGRDGSAGWVESQIRVAGSCRHVESRPNRVNRGRFGVRPELERMGSLARGRCGRRRRIRRWGRGGARRSSATRSRARTGTRGGRARPSVPRYRPRVRPHSHEWASESPRADGFTRRPDVRRRVRPSTPAACRRRPNVRRTPSSVPDRPGPVSGRNVLVTGRNVDPGGRSS